MIGSSGKKQNTGRTGKQLAPSATISGSALAGTVVVEATHETDALVRQVEEILSEPGVERMEVLVVCFDRQRQVVEAAVCSRFPTLRVISLRAEYPHEHAGRVLQEVKADKLSFLPAGSPSSALPFSDLPDDEKSLSILAPASGRLEPKQGSGSRGWLASTKLLRRLPSLRFPTDWNLLRLDLLLREQRCAVTWPSVLSTSPEIGISPPDGRTPIMGHQSSVLALIPHYHCEEWLESCLESTVAQTRQLDGIVVIDDGSDCPPTEIVKKFPQVTLLTAAETVGPYRLKQQVINSTKYDAYLLQDADDWSTNSRLELLLREAQRTGADVVGSQEIKFYCDREEVVPISYPADVNAALDLGGPLCDPLLHPACLISRQLMLRIGGFATGLRFAGDAEFLMRAKHAARIVNVPYYCYFRRRRAGSLTMSPETGMRSRARGEILKKLAARGAANAEAKAKGSPPDLTPAPMAGPVQLIHLVGPKLETA
jgi:hypothetical protein